MGLSRVLIVHNYYQHSGGEDVVFEGEKELLRSNGHDVFEYIDNNKRIDSLGNVNSAVQAVWSWPSYNAIKKVLQDIKPDIAHFHNTFMLISPSAYYACAEIGVPVVQTLHNYRLICPNALFFRDGVICEECINLKIPLPGILHKCYRDSRPQSAVVAGLLGIHKLIRTWQNKIDFYIALTEFARQKFIQGGLPERKIVVKPNFVTDIGTRSTSSAGEYVLYVGRLSSEKGIGTLLSAWGELHIPLKIVGDGPLAESARSHAERSVFIEYLGQISHKSVIDLLRQARFLVFTSNLYEGLPMTIVEAFACGVPVIASNLAARVELVVDSEMGLLYTPGDDADFATKVKWLWDNPQEVARMGANARKEYEEKYTPERNYQMLMDIYEKVIHGTP